MPSIVEHLARLFALRVLDVLAPRRCGACAAVAVNGPFCPDCFVRPAPGPTTIGAVPQARVSVLALGPFVPPLSLAIKQLKYSGRTDLAAPLANLWWRRWGPMIEARTQRDSPNVLVPVPLHPRRLIERGYNQSALLATCLARLARTRVEHGLIERVQATQQQARLTAHERVQNLEGAFIVADAARSCRASPARLVLVDDVVTTGATLSACQAACRSANLHLSEVWTLAQTEPGRARSSA